LDINEDIDLMVNEKLGILGNNGSGRTMIFKSIINDISYDEGSIQLFGYDNRKDFNKIKNKIGYCPQINVEFDSMKIREIVQFFLDLKSQKITVEFLCKKFCLQNYLDTYYNNLSFGNKRKLFLLISLIDYPELLLLDDPFNSVDDISKKIIIRYLKTLFYDNNYKCNILMSTNSLDEINELCNTNIFLKSEENNDGNSGDKKKIKNKNKYKYKLLIKFNDSLIIDNEDISNQKIQETLTKISSNVEGFDKYKNYFMNNSRLEPCLSKLADIFDKIIQHINHIKLSKIENNLLYVFDIIFVQKEIAYTKLIYIKDDESNHISELKVLKI
jgi:ABC-type multidrug transport system ATPase subunit